MYMWGWEDVSPETPIGIGMTIMLLNTIGEYLELVMLGWESLLATAKEKEAIHCLSCTDTCPIPLMYTSLCTSLGTGLHTG